MPHSLKLAVACALAVVFVAAPAQAVEVLQSGGYDQYGNQPQGNNQFQGNNADNYYATQNLLYGTHGNLVLAPPPQAHPCYPGNYSGNC